MSAAPASPTDPIAVGDNDPRLPTQNENDALAGNSGTAVSSSNKLIDAADVTQGFDANKIVRRDSAGQIAVPLDPGSSGFAASSKAYVDSKAEPNTYPNTMLVVPTYFTSILRPDANLGWTVTGTMTKYANGIVMQTIGNSRLDTTLAGAPTNNNALGWNSGIDLRMAYVFTPVGVSLGTTPSGSSDKWYFHGFGDNTAASTSGDITNTADRRIGFAHYNAKIYAVTCNGSAVTATEVDSTDDGAVKKHYLIDFTPTAARFYINGVLVATHTTNIPTTSTVFLNFAAYDSGGGGIGYYLSPITLSETLS
jgi:hypothetical protein